MIGGFGGLMNTVISALPFGGLLLDSAQRALVGPVKHPDEVMEDFFEFTGGSEGAEGAKADVDGIMSGFMDFTTRNQDDSDSDSDGDSGATY